jgi:hypothetical protein
MTVAFPNALVRTVGLPDATPMFPDRSTGAAQGWPNAALLAQISLIAVPLGAAFWYQTLVMLPALSSAIVPEYALLARVACVDHDPAEALMAALIGRTSTRLARLLHFIASPFGQQAHAIRFARLAG